MNDSSKVGKLKLFGCFLQHRSDDATLSQREGDGNGARYLPQCFGGELCRNFKHQRFDCKKSAHGFIVYPDGGRRTKLVIGSCLVQSLERYKMVWTFWMLTHDRCGGSI